VQFVASTVNEEVVMGAKFGSPTEMYSSFVTAPIYCGRRCRLWVVVTGAGIIMWNVAEASAEFDDGLPGDVDPPEPLAPPEERLADGMVPPTIP
jgi:hypothetical protein